MMRVLNALGSLRLALGGMAVLVLVILYDLQVSDLSPGWLAACLVLLCLNLAAAVLTRPQFRRQPGLLAFHLCLMMVAGLAGLQTMTIFQGRIEQVENQSFALENVEVVKQGPWHINRLGDVQFVQGPVTVEYRAGLRRGRTQSKIFYTEGGASRSIVFGDTQSMQKKGYRFVTTANKGYALTLVWVSDDGSSATGNIHMPSFPIREWDQSQQWRTPAGEEVTLFLEVPPVVADGIWTLASAGFAGRVLLTRKDGSRIEMRKGRSVEFSGGSLTLNDVVLWIGYRIEFNAILPWLFASAALGVAALGWHFWQNPPVFRAAGGKAHVA